MGKKVIWLIIVLIVVVLVVLLFSGKSTAPNGEGTSDGETGMMEDEEESAMDNEESMMEEEGDEAIMKENIITYTDSGFSPSSLTIGVDETITFKNNSSRIFWPATAVHPTHRVYPGSDIKKCGSGDEAGIFDACGGLNPGGEWQFRFGETGSWGYHNHLRPSNTGRVIVE